MNPFSLVVSGGSTRVLVDDASMKYGAMLPPTSNNELKILQSIGILQVALSTLKLNGISHFFLS